MVRTEFQEVNGSGEVDVQYLGRCCVPFLRSKAFLSRVGAANEKVESPQPLEGPVEGSRYCPVVRHVALHADDAVPGVLISEALFDAIQFVPAPSHDPDTPLLRQVSRREGETDAVRRAAEKDISHSFRISLRGSSLASHRSGISGYGNKIEGGCGSFGARADGRA